MPDTTNLIKVSGDKFVNTSVFPDTKLQTLDRRVGNYQLYFDKEQFRASVDSWAGIPIIYQKDGTHPTDFDAVRRDPLTAAEAIGGKLVGSVSNPRIVIPGGARLMAELDIYEDEDEIVALWQQGRLAPSTAFTANSDGDRIVSPPIPNHVLLFPVRVDEVLPGDPGAFVNTLEVQKNMKNEDIKKKKACNADADLTAMDAPTPADVEAVKEEVADVAEDVAEKQTELDQLKADLDLLKQELEALKQAATATEQEQPAETEQNEPEKTVTNSDTDGIPEEGIIKAKDAEIEQLKAENEALKVAKLALEEELSVLRANAAEAEFGALVEKLPAGMKATPEQVEALHTQYMKGDVKAMLHSVLASGAVSGATQRVGMPFTQSNKVSEYETVGDLNKPRNRN